MGESLLNHFAAAAILIKPYFAKMTRSEIHTVITSGLATIAGTVMAGEEHFKSLIFSMFTKFSTIIISGCIYLYNTNTICVTA